MPYKYEKRITLGTDAQGKRVRVRVYGNSKAELDRNEYAKRREFNNIYNPSDITFGDYAQQWLETYKSGRSVNTIAMYSNLLKKFMIIDEIPIKEVKKSNLQKIIQLNWDMPKTCYNIRMTAQQIFKAAYEDGIIARSPANTLVMPKMQKHKKRALTNEEREAVLNVKLRSMDRMYLDVLYSFGLRPGEALALTFDDFGEMLSINKAVAFDVNIPFIKSTKTGAERLIPIPDKIRTRLNTYKPECRSEYLFHNSDGNLMSKQGQYRMWKRIIERVSEYMGMPTDMTAYTLRHDFATRLYYVPGISFKKKAYLMGHSEKMLMDIYSHIDESNEDLSGLQYVQ